MKVTPVRNECVILTFGKKKKMSVVVSPGQIVNVAMKGDLGKLVRAFIKNKHLKKVK